MSISIPIGSTAFDPSRESAPVSSEVTILAVLPRPTEFPALPLGYRLITSGSIAALTREGPSYQSTPLLPDAAWLLPDVVRVDPQTPFSGPAALRGALERQRHELQAALEERGGCQEIRLSLLRRSRDGGGDDAAMVQEDARIVAKLAQTVKDLSRSACLTPKAYLPQSSAELKMALSLMVETDRVGELKDALTLADRMSRAHGLTLLISGPGPLESFPITGFCRAMKTAI